MNGSFFPPAESYPEPEPFVSPAWLQPPVDEYPARMLVREFLAQSSGSALSVSHVDVYTTGLRIKLDWEVRRTTETAQQWQLITANVFHHQGPDPERGRRFGLVLGDGITVTTPGTSRLQNLWNTEPDGPVLTDNGGGGGGGENRFSGSTLLWLWPLPPAGPVELVAEWREQKIEESRLVLDGDLLLSMVGDVRPLWAS